MKKRIQWVHLLSLCVFLSADLSSIFADIYDFGLNSWSLKFEKNESFLSLRQRQHFSLHNLFDFRFFC